MSWQILLKLGFCRPRDCLVSRQLMRLMNSKSNGPTFVWPFGLPDRLTASWWRGTDPDIWTMEILRGLDWIGGT